VGVGQRLGGVAVSALYFLLVAVVISAVGSGILVLRQRKPQGTRNSIESFQREMDALAPPDQRRQRR
jgi:hypothetical protein